jgi:hypothetical protein
MLERGDSNGRIHRLENGLREVTFFVRGSKPRTKGSFKPMRHKHTGKAILVPQQRETASWEAIVSYCAAQAWTGPPSKLPIEIFLEFVLQRPQTSGCSSSP